MKKTLKRVGILLMIGVIVYFAGFRSYGFTSNEAVVDAYLLNLENPSTCQIHFTDDSLLICESQTQTLSSYDYTYTITGSALDIVYVTGTKEDETTIDLEFILEKTPSFITQRVLYPYQYRISYIK
jgi:hypothetical protein